MKSLLWRSHGAVSESREQDERETPLVEAYMGRTEFGLVR